MGHGRPACAVCACSVYSCVAPRYCSSAWGLECVARPISYLLFFGVAAEVLVVEAGGG